MNPNLSDVLWQGLPACGWEEGRRFFQYFAFLTKKFHFTTQSFQRLLFRRQVLTPSSRKGSLALPLIIPQPTV